MNEKHQELTKPPPAEQQDAPPLAVDDIQWMPAVLYRQDTKKRTPGMLLLTSRNFGFRRTDGTVVMKASLLNLPKVSAGKSGPFRSILRLSYHNGSSSRQLFFELESLAAVMAAKRAFEGRIAEAKAAQEAAEAIVFNDLETLMEKGACIFESVEKEDDPNVPEYIRTNQQQRQSITEITLSSSKSLVEHELSQMKQEVHQMKQQVSALSQEVNKGKSKKKKKRTSRKKSVTQKS